jgi:hypothetical protein
MSTNPFDDDNGTFFVLLNDEDQHSCGRRSSTSPPAGGWSSVRAPARTAWPTSRRTGPTCAREACGKPWLAMSACAKSKQPTPDLSLCLLPCEAHGASSGLRPCCG